MLRFKSDKEGFYIELDCTIVKGDQKTLTAKDYTEVIAESVLSAEDTDIIKTGDVFPRYRSFVTSGRHG